MRKICLFFVSALLLLSQFSVFGAEVEYHFYIKRGKDHAPATTDERFVSLFGERAAFRDEQAVESGQKRLYLTFDAGYENGNVSKILDILKQEEVRGAFFVLSHLLTSESVLVRRMKEEGHLVCNHTAHHKNMAQLSNEAFEKELRALEEVYSETQNATLARYYRPPEGTFSARNLDRAEKMGYKTVFWSLAYADWNDKVAPCDEKAIKILKENTHPGAIVLLHPTSEINTRILGEMIRYWKDEGYTFHTLDELP